MLTFSCLTDAAHIPATTTRHITTRSSASTEGTIRTFSYVTSQESQRRISEESQEDNNGNNNNSASKSGEYLFHVLGVQEIILVISVSYVNLMYLVFW